VPHDIRVSKFWEWGFSDLRLNIVRGILAEFLVREAVGDTQPERIAWDNFDVLMPSPSHPNGIRIEVKSSGYWQSWPQRDKSRIGFSGLTARTWKEDGSYSVEREIRADVHVFAVHACTDPNDYRPLDVAQWDFYVLSADVVRNYAGRSMSFATLRRYAPEPVPWGNLAEGVRQAAEASSKQSKQPTRMRTG
jgi:hypothetical protein